MELIFAEETWVLLPQKAVWHPATRTLLVADLHLGKDATFRARGMAVPAGSDQDTLGRLQQLVQHIQPSRLEILGDLFHGVESRKPEAQAEFWNQIRGFLPMQTRWITGNHDRHVRTSSTQEAAREAGVEIATEAFLQHIRLCHEPPEDGFFICGHLHPGFLLTGKGRQRMKLPCFWKTERGLVLPAFGAFTGLHIFRPKLGDGVFVVAGNSVQMVRIT